MYMISYRKKRGVMMAFASLDYFLKLSKLLRLMKSMRRPVATKAIN